MRARAFNPCCTFATKLFYCYINSIIMHYCLFSHILDCRTFYDTVSASKYRRVEKLPKQHNSAPSLSIYAVLHNNGSPVTSQPVGLFEILKRLLLLCLNCQIQQKDCLARPVYFSAVSQNQIIDFCDARFKVRAR